MERPSATIWGWTGSTAPPNRSFCNSIRRVVTSTFIEGLVGPSVGALGYDGFKHKYWIEATPPVRENVLSMARYLDDVKAK